MFELTHPLDGLGDMLMKDFAGQTVTMQQIYERHNVGKPFIKRNYKNVLSALEVAGKIMAIPSVAERKAGTFADRVKVIFPEMAKT
jgi:hypothetical protein